MKKILIMVLAFAMAMAMGIAMTGCGSGSGSGSDSGSDGGSPAPAAKPSVDLSQVEWNVESGIVDGVRAVVFGYTNNTDYEIVDFDLEFKVKEGVTSEQLEASSELKEKASDMDHDIGEITFSAITHKCVAPGDSVENCVCNLDGTIQYYTDFDSYELFEPDMMTAVVASDGKVYAAYYDFASGKTTMGDDAEDAYTWSDSAIAKALPKPDVRYLMITSDDEDYLSAEAYGVSEDTFEAYVAACKENGFDQDVDEYDGNFTAKNADGIEVDVSYISSDDQMYITADKEETE